MNFDTSQFAADLPPPRDDEPASLRQDIVDELADHLECALRRELLASGGRESPDGGGSPDSSFRTARQTVLTRFGNPAAVARRLWLDAMKERLMAQKIMLASVIAMTAICFAMFAVIWRDIADQRDQFSTLLAETSALNAELAEQARASAEAARGAIADGREFQQQMTARLEQIASQSDQPADWNPVEFKLVAGGEDGPPAVGFNVSMTITTREAGLPSYNATSSEAGVIKFDRVRYGAYEAVFTAPWEETHRRRVTIHPGKGYTATISCPESAPNEQWVSLHVEWPEELQDEPILWHFAPQSLSRVIGKTEWLRTGYGGSLGRSRSGFAPGAPVVAPDGRLLVDSLTRGLARYVLDGEAQERWDKLQDDVRSLSLQQRVFTQERVATQIIRDPLTRLRWPGDDYSFDDIIFAMPATAENLQKYRNGEAIELRNLTQVGRLDADDVSYRIEEGDPARLILSPTPQLATEIREAITIIEQKTSDRGRTFRDTRDLIRFQRDATIQRSDGGDAS